ncbi:FixH family protein [Salibaculum sp.]|uniref:FixH family protein n=1 Tax=Salibaculum sp. TaxID=2855480 RepID=UPI002B474477|nr:FixH family protein [Salibaculum sp.]HKL69525.1 FixH family protein [Salibaculum sp.]
MVITGRKVFLIFAGAFAVIISVNLLLAFSAVRTFPGLEVKNSYVASQNWDEERAAQLALDWTVDAVVRDEMLTLSITDAMGAPVEVQSLSGVFGRATSVKDDQTPAFEFNGEAYVAPVQTSDGNWNLRLEAVAPDGTDFRQRIVVLVD